ncbi:MAG: hypothetical protein U0359_23335 [Byssovorax sp.]
MREAFISGGWGMYPTLVFGLLMIGASVRYAIRPEKRAVPLLVSLGIMSLLSGALGFVTGVIKSFLAMGQVKPDERWIWMLGVGESLNVMALALVLALLASLVATVGVYRLSRVPPEPEIA